MKDIIVISDTHFGAGPENEKREDDFVKLLYNNSGKDIVLLGDIFDFWIEYKSVIYRRYFRLLHELVKVIERGDTVYFIPGNHDFYNTDFLSEIGLLVKPEGISFKWKGRTVFLHHGDVFSSRGKFNRFFYGNWLTRTVFKAFHPDIGINIAKMVSKTSTKKPVHRKVVMPEGIEELFEKYDIVITGHTHTPGVLELANGKYYINSGEWLHGRCYVEILGDAIYLKESDRVLSTFT